MPGDCLLAEITYVYIDGIYILMTIAPLDILFSWQKFYSFRGHAKLKLLLYSTCDEKLNHHNN